MKDKELKIWQLYDCVQYNYIILHYISHIILDIAMQFKLIDRIACNELCPHLDFCSHLHVRTIDVKFVNRQNLCVVISWCTGTRLSNGKSKMAGRAREAIVCLKDFETYAHRAIDKVHLDFFEGGADEEETLRSNVEAFKRWDRNKRSLLLTPHRLIGTAVTSGLGIVYYI